MMPPSAVVNHELDIGEVATVQITGKIILDGRVVYTLKVLRPL
jgi:hypothetical protein